MKLLGGRLGGDGEVWPDPPNWLPQPLKKALSHFTHDEAHATGLGLIGLPSGAALASGATIPTAAAAAASLALLLVALFDLPEESGGGAKVLSKETWYFVAAYVITAAAGYALLA